MNTPFKIKVKNNTNSSKKVSSKDNSAYLKIPKKTLTSLVLIGLLLISAFLVGSIIAKESFNNNHQSVLPTIIPTTPPSETPTLIPTKAKVYPTTDPDPIIDCESSAPNCKGTSIRVRRSQCSKITCCQVGNNWSIYSTNEKCDEAQNNSNNVVQAGETKINCSYNSGVYKYDYGMLSYNECAIKRDAYWNGLKVDYQPLPTLTPLSTTVPTLYRLKPNDDYYLCSDSRSVWCSQTGTNGNDPDYQRKCVTEAGTDIYYCPHGGTHKSSSQVRGLENLGPNECVCVF